MLAPICVVLLIEAWFPQLSKADGDEETVDQIMEHVSVSYDAQKQITWYIPKIDAQEAETCVYASLGVRDGGERRLILNIHKLNGDLWFARRLRVETNGFPRIMRLDPAKHRIAGNSTPSGISETLLMDDQEQLIRDIANANQASITLSGEKQDGQKFDLPPKDITNFLRIVTLFDTATLPPAQESADHGGEQRRTDSNGAGVFTDPRVIEKAKKTPLYPKRARKAHVQGLAILYAVVNKDGSVGDIRVARTPADGMGFEEAVLAAVKKWRYEPALLDGKPVDVYFTIVVDFRLH